MQLNFLFCHITMQYLFFSVVFHTNGKPILFVGYATIPQTNQYAAIQVHIFFFPDLNSLLHTRNGFDRVRKICHNRPIPGYTPGVLFINSAMSVRFRKGAQRMINKNQLQSTKDPQRKIRNMTLIVACITGFFVVTAVVLLTLLNHVMLQQTRQYLGEISNQCRATIEK